MEHEVLSPQAGSKNIFLRYFTAMPVFFPLVGLFLLGQFCYESWSYLTETDLPSIYLLRPAVLLLYVVFWSAACVARKWGAIAFIILTILNVSFYLFAPDMLLKHIFGDLLFVPIPVNLLFAFLLLFYFRRFK